MHRNTARPLSPHLTIWRWGPHMAVSILNRVTGVGLSIVGAAGFVWWLVAAATGAEAYNSFLDVATSWLGILVGVGLTWALVFHTGGGIRHYVLDIGAGYELRTNRRWSWITIIGSFVVTAAIWAYILGVK
ncbi:MAG TPA: succinate dehydrogenase, cytochrome b556 subunit [Sphingomonadaceae bacterium]|nr:succinate dehydrogenase, cytochrome b556 subunit [Sphingomonadaceae bacterium]